MLRAPIFVLRGRLSVQFSREFTSFACSADRKSSLLTALPSFNYLSRACFSYLLPLTSYLLPLTSYLSPLTSGKCVSLVSPVSPLKKVANALYIGVVSACQPIFQKILAEQGREIGVFLKKVPFHLVMSSKLSIFASFY